MKEEDVLLKNVGKKNAFKVPDGYFESFTDTLMNNLPEKEDLPIEKPATTWMKLRPWVYMAAVFIGAALMVRVLTFTRKNGAEMQSPSTAKTEMSQDKYIDEAVDNTRLDSYQLYQYLSEAQNENY